MILNELIEKECVLPELVAKIKSENIPLMILGGGDRARYLYEFLLGNEIQVSSVAVNQKYWKPSSYLLGTNIPLDVFEVELEKHEKVNVILGFSSSLLKEQLHDSKINYVYSISVGLSKDYIMSYDYLVKNAEEFDWLYHNLADDLSRNLFVANLNGRISGKDISFEPATWTDPQYFLHEFMVWNKEELLVDGGAYDGDTAKEFISKMSTSDVEKYQVCCFEPDKKNAGKIQDTFGDDKNIKVYGCGLWKDKRTLYFDNTMGADGGGRVSDIGKQKIEVDSLDNVLGEQKVTFIKLDIEGSELEALHGAAGVIKRDKPSLAVCMYHKQGDYITLAQYIYSLVREYKFYLRTHSSMPTELVLFCINKREVKNG